MSLSFDLVTHAAVLAVRPFEAAEIGAARRLLLDHLGVAVRGSTTPEAQASRAMVAELTSGSPGGGRMPVLGTSVSVPVLAGAYLNALASHAIEMDDVHNASSSHPGAVVWPAALAAAVIADADDRQLLSGAIVGYEVMGRVGRAANPAAHYRRHFHPTGTVGHFAAAAAAAVILGLDERGILMALGIANSSAAGSMEFLVDGAWTKRLHPANAARNGVEAALLARAGYVGTRDPIGGERGFLAAYSDDPWPEQLLAGWGERPLEVAATSVKPHACCRYNQTAIDALLRLRERHHLSGEECVRIEVGLPTAGYDIVGQPIEHKRNPQSVVDAQFSMPFSAAAAIVHGQVGVDQFTSDALEDVRVRHVMERVECVASPEIDAYFPDEWRGWARVTTTDERVLEERVDAPWGDPSNALTQDEMWTKFDSLCMPIWSEAARTRLWQRVSTMGGDQSVRTLIDALAGDGE